MGNYQNISCNILLWLGKASNFSHFLKSLGNHKMQKLDSKHFARRPLPLTPPPTMRMGSVGQNQTFSENGHVAYQYKRESWMREHGIKRCSSMVANILPAIPYPPPPTHTHTTNPGDGVSRSKLNFFRTWSCCISNLRESRMQQHCSKYFALRHPWPCG